VTQPLPRRTERLLLRGFTPSDFDGLHTYHSRTDVVRWLYWPPRNADEVRALLERRLGYTTIARPGDNLAVAVELAATGELIGDCGLQWIDNEHLQGEIGFIVHPDHHGHGYATEAARELLRIAFDELPLHRVIGRTEARNDASARVLEKLGMRREAHLVENEYVKGEWQSELIYALLDREWRAAAAAARTTARPG
jgi:RimJ/RimL family protein N-acetyltransferase